MNRRLDRLERQAADWRRRYIESLSDDELAFIATGGRCKTAAELTDDELQRMLAAGDNVAEEKMQRP